MKADPKTMRRLAEALGMAAEEMFLDVTPSPMNEFRFGSSLPSGPLEPRLKELREELGAVSAAAH